MSTLLTKEKPEVTGPVTLQLPVTILEQCTRIKDNVVQYLGQWLTAFKLSKILSEIAQHCETQKSRAYRKAEETYQQSLMEQIDYVQQKNFDMSTTLAKFLSVFCKPQDELDQPTERQARDYMLMFHNKLKVSSQKTHHKAKNLLQKNLHTKATVVLNLLSSAAAVRSAKGKAVKLLHIAACFKNCFDFSVILLKCVSNWKQIKKTLTSLASKLCDKLTGLVREDSDLDTTFQELVNGDDPTLVQQPVPNPHELDLTSRVVDFADMTVEEIEEEDLMHHILREQQVKNLQKRAQEIEERLAQPYQLDIQAANEFAASLHKVQVHREKEVEPGVVSEVPIGEYYANSTRADFLREQELVKKDREAIQGMNEELEAIEARMRELESEAELLIVEPPEPVTLDPEELQSFEDYSNEVEQKAGKINPLSAILHCAVGVGIAIAYKSGIKTTSINSFLSLLKNYKNFIKEGKESIGEIVDFFLGQETYEDVIVARYERLIKLGDALLKADVRAFAKNAEALRILDNFTRSAVALTSAAGEIKDMRRITGLSRLLVSMVESIRNKKEAINNSFKTTSQRVPTRFFQIWGAPAIGKSHVVADLTKRITAYFGWKNEVYNVKLNNEKYWSTYAGQKVGILDEFLRKPEEPFLDYALDMASCNSFNMAGASIQEKYQLCDLRAVFLLSNVERLAQTGQITQEAEKALWSRFSVWKMRKPNVEKQLKDDATNRFDLAHLHDKNFADTYFERRTSETSVEQKTYPQFVDFVIAELEKTAQTYPEDPVIAKEVENISSAWTTFCDSDVVQKDGENFFIGLSGPSQQGKTFKCENFLIPRLVQVTGMPWKKVTQKLPRADDNHIYFFDDYYSHSEYQQFTNTVSNCIFIHSSNLDVQRHSYRVFPQMTKVTYTKVKGITMDSSVKGFLRRIGIGGPTQIGATKVDLMSMGIHVTVNARHCCLDGKPISDEQFWDITCQKLSRFHARSNEIQIVPMDVVLPGLDLYLKCKDIAELKNIEKLVGQKFARGDLKASQQLIDRFSRIPPISKTGLDVNEKGVKDFATYMLDYMPEVRAHVIVGNHWIKINQGRVHSNIQSPVRATVVVNNDSIKVYGITYTPIQILSILNKKYESCSGQELKVRALRQQLSDIPIVKDQITRFRVKCLENAQRARRLALLITLAKYIPIGLVIGITLVAIALLAKFLVKKEYNPVSVPTITEVTQKDTEEYDSKRNDVKWKRAKPQVKKGAANLNNGQYRENTSEDIAEIFEQSKVRVYGQGGKYLIGTMIFGTVGLCPAHVSKNPDDDLEVVVEGKTFDAKVLSHDIESDVIYFYIDNPKCRKFRDLTAHFAPREAVVSSTQGILYFKKGKTMRTFVADKQFVPSRIFFDSEKGEHLDFCLNIQVLEKRNNLDLTRPGDCGSHLFIVYKKRTYFAGFLSVESPAYLGMASVCSEDFGSFMVSQNSTTVETPKEDEHHPFLDIQIPEGSWYTKQEINGRPYCVLADELRYLQEQVRDQEQLSPMELESVDLLAVSKKPCNTNVTDTRMILKSSKDMIHPNLMANASTNLAGVNTEGWKCMRIKGNVVPSQLCQQIDLFEVKEVEPPSELAQAKELLVADYTRILDVEIKTLNLADTLSGIQEGPLRPHMSSVNTSSTAGVIAERCFNARFKRDIVEFNGTGFEFRSNWAGKKTKYRFERMCTLVEKGEAVLTIYKDAMKGELLPMQKVYKDGKIRLFQVNGMEEFLMCRKYFGAVTAAFNYRWKELHSTIGMDQRQDIETVINRLAKTSLFGEDGDFKRYDKSLPEWLVKTAIEVLIAMYPSTDTKGNTARRTLGEMLIHSIHHAGPVIYQKHQGNPSGNYLTTLLNCVCNDLMMITTYLVAAKRANQEPDFGKIDWVCLGDDLTLVIDPEIASWYNFKVRKELYLSLFGMTYTLASKDGKEVISKPLHELTFISRFFEHREGRWWGVAKPETFSRILHWTSEESDEQIASQLDTILIEAVMGGREFFEEYRVDVEMILRHYPGVLQYMHNVIDYEWCLSMHNAEREGKEAPLKGLYFNLKRFGITEPEQQPKYIPFVIAANSSEYLRGKNINVIMEPVQQLIKFAQEQGLAPPIYVEYEPFDGFPVDCKFDGMSVTGKSKRKKDAKKMAASLMWGRVLEKEFKSGRRGIAQVEADLDKFILYCRGNQIDTVVAIEAQHKNIRSQIHSLGKGVGHAVKACVSDIAVQTQKARPTELVDSMGTECVVKDKDEVRSIALTAKNLLLKDTVAKKDVDYRSNRVDPEYDILAKAMNMLAAMQVARHHAGDSVQGPAGTARPATRANNMTMATDYTHNYGTKANFLMFVYSLFSEVSGTSSYQITSDQQKGVFLFSRNVTTMRNAPAAHWIDLHYAQYIIDSFRIELYSQSNIGGSVRFYISLAADSVFDPVKSMEFWYQDVPIDGSTVVEFSIGPQLFDKMFSKPNNGDERFFLNCIIYSPLRGVISGTTSTAYCEMIIKHKLDRRTALKGIRTEGISVVSKSLTPSLEIPLNSVINVNDRFVTDGVYHMPCVSVNVNNRMIAEPTFVEARDTRMQQQIYSQDNLYWFQDNPFETGKDGTLIIKQRINETLQHKQMDTAGNWYGEMHPYTGFDQFMENYEGADNTCHSWGTAIGTEERTAWLTKVPAFNESLFRMESIGDSCIAMQHNVEGVSYAMYKEAPTFKGVSYWGVDEYTFDHEWFDGEVYRTVLSTAGAVVFQRQVRNAMKQIRMGEVIFNVAKPLDYLVTRGAGIQGPVSERSAAFHFWIKQISSQMKQSWAFEVYDKSTRSTLLYVKVQGTDMTIVPSDLTDAEYLAFPDPAQAGDFVIHNLKAVSDGYVPPASNLSRWVSLYATPSNVRSARAKALGTLEARFEKKLAEWKEQGRLNNLLKKKPNVSVKSLDQKATPRPVPMEVDEAKHHMMPAVVAGVGKGIGGLFAGLGEAASAVYQAKVMMVMQDKSLSSQEKRQQIQIEHEKYLKELEQAFLKEMQEYKMAGQLNLQNDSQTHDKEMAKLHQEQWKQKQEYLKGYDMATKYAGLGAAAWNERLAEWQKDSSGLAGSLNTATQVPPPKEYVPSQVTALQEASKDLAAKIKAEEAKPLPSVAELKAAQAATELTDEDYANIDAWLDREEEVVAEPTFEEEAFMDSFFSTVEPDPQPTGWNPNEDLEAMFIKASDDPVPLPAINEAVSPQAQLLEPGQPGTAELATEAVNPHAQKLQPF